MKYILMCLTLCCTNPNKIQYTHTSPVEITCVGCDSVSDSSLIVCVWANPNGTLKNCYSEDKNGKIILFQETCRTKLLDTIYASDWPYQRDPIEIHDDSIGLGGNLYTDTTIEFFNRRIKQLDDSIALIRKQNKWLDSVNKSLGPLLHLDSGGRITIESNGNSGSDSVLSPVPRKYDPGMTTDTVPWKPYYVPKKKK